VNANHSAESQRVHYFHVGKFHAEHLTAGTLNLQFGVVVAIAVSHFPLTFFKLGFAALAAGDALRV